MPLKREGKTPSKPSKTAQDRSKQPRPVQVPKEPKRKPRKRIQDKVSPEAPKPTADEILRDDKEYLFLEGYPDLNTHQKRFLLAFSLVCNLTEAAELVKCCRTTHYIWMEQESYRRAFATANEIAVDRLQGIAKRRAELISDTLMITLLKAWRPEVFNPPQQYRHKTESTIAANIGGQPENPLLVKQDNVDVWKHLQPETVQMIYRDLTNAGVKDE